MYESWTVVYVFVFLSCSVEGLQTKRQKNDWRKKILRTTYKVACVSSHTSRMNRILSRWQVPLSPSPKTLTISFVIFLSVAMAIWHGYSMYGFHCRLSSALPICTAEWISRTHLISQSNIYIYIYTYIKNTTLLEAQRDGHQALMSEYNFFLCAFVSLRETVNLPHSVKTSQGDRKRGKRGEERVLRQSFSSWQCLWDALRIGGPHLIWMSGTWSGVWNNLFQSAAHKSFN